MPTRIPPPRRGEDKPAAMGIEPETCRQIAELFTKAFVWEETAEGHGFWHTVALRMYELARLADREDKGRTPPPLPAPPARPSSLAAASDIRDALDQGADSVEVDYHPAIPEWSLYLRHGALTTWMADYEIGINPDQYTAEEAEALAFDYAERLLEAFPQLRAHGINPKE